MRTPLARLVGVAAAGALIISPLAIAGPANAAGNGTISVKIVDDVGQPVTGVVSLVPAGGGETIMLGLPEPEEEGDYVPPVPASLFVEEIPAGTYGAMVMGGWAGITCVGLATCSATAIMGMGGAAMPLGAGAFTVGDGGATPLTITVATPKLTGGPGVGQPLAVSVPSSLTELGVLFSALVAGGGGGAPGLMGLSTDPVITWNRNGASNGVTGKTYTPTTAHAGSTVSATLTFPPLLAMYFGVMAPGIAPAPFTTAAVSINKLTPSVKLSVPGKIKVGKRPTAYVNVQVGQTPVGGVVTFVVGKTRPQQAVLRSGLATFKLPKLKPGKYKVTASIAEAGPNNAAKTTKTVVVKGKKPKKGKGKKK